MLARSARPRWLTPLLVGMVALAATLCWTILRHDIRQSRNDDVFREALCRIDANGDGRVSREEWTRYDEYGTLVFDAYDFDDDGFLDVSEFTAMFENSDPGYSQPRLEQK